MSSRPTLDPVRIRRAPRHKNEEDWYSMIRPLPALQLSEVLTDGDDHPGAFPILDRAFDAVERALERLGVENPALLRSPRPVEEALSDTALPEGTLLVLSPSELRAAEVDIEDTVKDERQGGAVYLSLPGAPELPTRARGLRELASAVTTFGLNPSLRPAPASRLGRLRQVPMPLHLRNYRFLLADTPGFRVTMVARSLPGGGMIGLWSGNERVIAEVHHAVSLAARAVGYDVPTASAPVPELEGIDQPRDVWLQAETLRAYRVVRQAELREIARAAALRGVALRREREAAKRQMARSCAPTLQPVPQRATGT